MPLITQRDLQPHLPRIKAGLLILAILGTILAGIKMTWMRDWAEVRVQVIYSLPMVFIFFMWVRAKLDDPKVYQIEVLLIDLLVLGLTLMRLFGLLFHSGHVLFLLYTYMTTTQKEYRTVALIMLTLSIYMKLEYWNDWGTPIIGGLMAMVFYYIRDKEAELKGRFW